MLALVLRRALLPALVLAAAVAPSAALAGPTYRYAVTNPDGAYLGNDVSGFVLGYAFPKDALPSVNHSAAVYVQRTARKDEGGTTRVYGYGRVVRSLFGHWSAGANCAWVRLGDLGPRGRRVSGGNVCREPSRRTPGGGLAEKRIFRRGTYTRGCGNGDCVGPARIKACSNLGIYANYNPREGRKGFHNKLGVETVGRGSRGYPGTTIAVRGFGTRYETRNRVAILIKDNQDGAPGRTPWKFVRSECVSGSQTGR